MSEISIGPKRNMYNETKIEESFKFKYFTAFALSLFISKISDFNFLSEFEMLNEKIQ
jgi:hypothetical protein